MEINMSDPNIFSIMRLIDIIIIIFHIIFCSVKRSDQV